MARMTLPLFPLRTVLFPEGPLPLRVFEPRYLDLVSRCLREQSLFGVLLLRAGSEVGAVAQTATFGTMARIIDWYQGSDGILGITAVGTERFELVEVEQQTDGLYVGSVMPVPPEPALALPGRYQPMVELLEAILADLGKLYDAVPRRFDDATWVGCRFAEILPMPLEQKQQCLELSDPLARLELVRPLLRPERPGTMQ